MSVYPTLAMSILALGLMLDLKKVPGLSAIEAIYERLGDEAGEDLFCPLPARA